MATILFESTTALNLMEFLSEILVILDLNKRKSHYFILGDTNINVSFKSSNNATEYLNMLSFNSAVSLITTSTRVTDSIATILGHILTNENCFSLLLFLINHFIADRFSVIVSISCNFSCRHTQLKFINSFFYIFC